ncbi:MAG: ATP-binding protein [Desulfovibrionaceae bacterium]
MDTFVLTTLAHPGPSRKLAKAAVAILYESISDRELIYRCDLALTEACANVVRHAYKQCEPGKLQITLTLTPGACVDVEVIDWGCGFDHLPVSVVNATPDAEGGRGLYIMSELADSFAVRQDEGRNIVYFKILVQESSWTPYK